MEVFSHVNDLPLLIGAAAVAIATTIIGCAAIVNASRLYREKHDEKHAVHGMSRRAS
jgi:hypothetical protein